MKKIKNILLGITALASVTACTDNDRADYTVDKPESVAIREALNQYDALKTYIDKEQNPIFKIGAGIDYTTYTDKGVLYRMLNTNFDELSLIGNQMQHGSLISNDGSLDTLTLTSLFEVAKDAGVSVFGHTLCGSENQNSAYLNNIIVPSTIEAEGNLLNVADLKKGAFTGWSNAGDFVVTSTGGVRDEGIVFSSSTNTPWELTLASPSISIDPTKDYYLSFYVKPSAVGKIRIYFDKTTFNYPSAGLKDLPEAGTWQRVYYQIPGFKAGTEAFQFFIDFGYISAVNYAIDITSFTLKEGIVDPNDRSQLIERTDEEKTEVINDALDSYISGMMKMCTPAVNSWTVVNEPMDDANPSMLKTGEGKTLGSGEFYWQDYIGEYYAAKAIELARKYYAENGGIQLVGQFGEMCRSDQLYQENRDGQRGESRWYCHRVEGCLWSHSDRISQNTILYIGGHWQTGEDLEVRTGLQGKGCCRKFEGCKPDCRAANGTV